jgi:DNA-binding LytR/AlgR family response regulator
MKCIIIDDEPLAVEGMKLNIAKVDFLELVGTFNDVIEANTFLQNNTIDLLFLDVEMPDITGLQYLDTLEKKPLTIMATAYPQFAVEGFELGVIDYITKPIDFLRFVKAANRACFSI